MHSYPLLEVFIQVQKRSLSLGINEYFAVLNALEQGFGSSRSTLLQTCQLIWAKSTEQREIIRDVFVSSIPPSLSADVLTEILDEIEENRRDEQITPQDSKTSDRSQLPSAPKLKTEQESLKEQKTTQEKLDLQWGHGQASFSIWEPNAQISLVSSQYDFNPRATINSRIVSRTLRYYRKMERTGSKTVFDIEATIENTYNQGMFLEPIMVAPRRNAARLIVLIDVKGSMRPFELLINSIEDGVELSRMQNVSLYYFHDVPDEFLFVDRNLSDGKRISNVLSSSNRYSLLLISDAGAARRSLDKKRIQASWAFLNMVNQHTSNISWLNPVPRERWKGTSAEYIAQKCSMIYFDKQGLYKAIKNLQGMTV